MVPGDFWCGVCPCSYTAARLVKAQQVDGPGGCTDVWTQPSRNSTDSRRRSPLQEDRALAFAMALHPRLGRASWAFRLDPALARHIVEELCTEPRRAEY